jgi:hypothetical protein
MADPNAMVFCSNKGVARIPFARFVTRSLRREHQEEKWADYCVRKVRLFCNRDRQVLQIVDKVYRRLKFLCNIECNAKVESFELLL